MRASDIHGIVTGLCGGMSLLIQPEDIEQVRECIEKHHAEYHDIAALPCQINPRRNRFC